MTARILADENVDHRVVHRLENYGHDVEHVDFAAQLDKGSDDSDVAEYSLETDRLLLTSDDDFLTDFGTTEYTGLLFVDDDALGPVAISDIVNEIVTSVTDPSGHTYYVSRNWL